MARKSRRVARRRKFLGIGLLIAVLLLFLSLFPHAFFSFVQFMGAFLGNISGYVVGVFGDLRLEIYDVTEFGCGGVPCQRFTFCSQYCGPKGDKDPTDWDVQFYANFTRVSTGEVITSSLGNCSIRFSLGSSVFNMSFNATSNLWGYSTSFLYKGNHTFFVNCTSGGENASLADNFVILNTRPYIIQTINGYIDVDGSGGASSGDLYPCTEDIPCFYNFTSNISEDDLNDLLTFGYNPSPVNTSLTNFTLYGDGMLLINVTHTNYTGLRQIELNVRDSGDQGSGIVTQSALLRVNIQQVNDAPFFVNLKDKSFNETQLFTFIVNASDEENDYPLSFNVSFDSCETAPWSTRGSNCTLFDIVNYSDRSFLINFTPSANDVGNYTINFTVTDLNNTVSPYNASRSQVATFRVLNINDAPYFTFLCGGGSPTTVEDDFFSCQINASDPDDSILNFSSNVTWFLNATNAPLVAGNASVVVNLVPDDSQVGNWSVNVSVSDYGQPRKSNSTALQLYIGNKNDSVFLFPLQNITAYKDAYYQIQINASDNDLLIPDKRILDEQLTFAANVSWINFILPRVTGNITSVLMNFTITESLVGNHTIGVNVSDRFGFSNFSRIFTVFAYNNTAPIWNLNPFFTLMENDGFILDLLQNVSDPDGDSLSFSHVSLTYFPSFSRIGGMISFTTSDGDVGLQNVVVNASDGKLGISSILLVYNITNVDDNPRVQQIGDQNATEDNRTRIFIDLLDGDLAIQQKSYFNESLTYQATIVGVNTGLFTPVFDSLGRDYVRIVLDFIPRKADVGNYTVIVNVSDRTGLNDSYTFNLSVFAINHPPALPFFDNQSTGVGIPFFLDVNASDIEDGGESSGNLTYSIAFLLGPRFFTINSSNGVINFTADASQAGRYQVNLSVTESSGLSSSRVFWIFVYDVPRITALTPSPISGVENFNITVNVRGNHTVGDLLRFEWYINDELRNVSMGNGTGGLTQLIYRLSFNDETTCGRNKNLTVNVSNPLFSTMTSWGLNINHTDQQPLFVNGPLQNITAGNSYTVDLLFYFQDADYGDPCYPNASLVFSFSRYNESLDEQASGPLTVTFEPGDRITFSSSQLAGEYFRLSASDGNVTVFSNIFHVMLDPVTVPVPQPVPQPQPFPQPVPKPEPKILRIITPEKITLLKPGVVQIPLQLKNEGEVDLFDIDLITVLVKDGIEIKKPNLTLSRNFFSLLTPGQSQNVSIELLVNGSGRITYELFVNASVRSPRFVDWAKVNIELIESNITEVEKILIFTEELVVENPECLELKELLDEAKELYQKGETQEALRKTDAIVESCKQALAQKNRLFFIERKDFSLIFYVAVLSIAFLFSGVLYHFLRKWIFRRKVGEIQEQDKGGYKKV